MEGIWKVHKMKKELLLFDEPNYYYPTNMNVPQVMPNVQHLNHFNSIDETFFQMQGKIIFFVVFFSIPRRCKMNIFQTEKKYYKILSLIGIEEKKKREMMNNYNL